MTRCQVAELYVQVNVRSCKLFFIPLKHFFILSVLYFALPHNMSPVFCVYLLHSDDGFLFDKLTS